MNNEKMVEAWLKNHQPTKLPDVVDPNAKILNELDENSLCSSNSDTTITQSVRMYRDNAYGKRCSCCDVVISEENVNLFEGYFNSRPNTKTMLCSTCATYTGSERTQIRTVGMENFLKARDIKVIISKNHDEQAQLKLRKKAYTAVQGHRYASDDERDEYNKISLRLTELTSLNSSLSVERRKLLKGC